jgi:antitoxin (DNA-binding transcriptional repressor) of toxin-antitoxin stability system
MAAGRFKDQCLKALDDVARTKSALVITKRGRPVAKLVPVTTAPPRSLAGSVLEEHGDPFSTGVAWDAGRP